jgi:AraC-like DNA-binding protein
MASTGFLRVAPLAPLLKILQKANIDSRRLLAEFGVSPDYFQNTENVISFRVIGRIFARCAQRTECPHFGLLVGEQSGLSSLGAVGYLVESAPNVRIALRELASYLHIHDRGAIATVSVSNSFANLGYAILTAGVDGSEYLLDVAMAIAFNIMKGLCGPDWRPSRVLFAHSLLGNVNPYRRFFGVTPTFDADETALIFDADWLDRSLVSADPILHELMKERAGELQSRSESNLVEELRRVLSALVTSQQDCSLEVVAKRVGMRGRTLNRELAAEGTTFRKTREDVRLEIACQLLRDSRKPAHEIASVLGYSDATVFSRAFRRWSGVAPSRWRVSKKTSR